MYAVTPEPAWVSVPNTTHNPKGNRWRWWYSAICNHRLRNPGCQVQEVAAAIGKNVATISAIINSDMYREYEAQRFEIWRAQHDALLRQKLTGVTLKALDAIDAQLEKKRDQIPLEMVREIMTSGLDRLGFAPQSAAPAVTIHNNQVVVPNSVSPLALEEARMALRAVEARRLPNPVIDSELADVKLEVEPPPSEAEHGG